MLHYDLLEVEKNLDEICYMVANKETDGVVITINGEPQAKIVSIEE